MSLPTSADTVIGMTTIPTGQHGSAHRARIGADVGGTFTDIVVQTVDGTLHSTKVLTTYDAPEQGILAGIEQLSRETGIDLRHVDQIIHGTTLATNALIERRGAKPGSTDAVRLVGLARPPERPPDLRRL